MFLMSQLVLTIRKCFVYFGSLVGVLLRVISLSTLVCLPCFTLLIICEQEFGNLVGGWGSIHPLWLFLPSCAFRVLLLFGLVFFVYLAFWCVRRRNEMFRFSFLATMFVEAFGWLAMISLPIVIISALSTTPRYHCNPVHLTEWGILLCVFFQYKGKFRPTLKRDWYASRNTRREEDEAQIVRDHIEWNAMVVIDQRELDADYQRQLDSLVNERWYFWRVKFYLHSLELQITSSAIYFGGVRRIPDQRGFRRRFRWTALRRFGVWQPRRKTMFLTMYRKAMLPSEGEVLFCSRMYKRHIRKCDGQLWRLAVGLRCARIRLYDAGLPVPFYFSLHDTRRQLPYRVCNEFKS